MALSNVIKYASNILIEKICNLKSELLLNDKTNIPLFFIYVDYF